MELLEINAFIIYIQFCFLYRLFIIGGYIHIFITPVLVLFYLNAAFIHLDFETD